MDNQRNLILAVVLCLGLLLGFDLLMGRLYPDPAPTEQVTPEADTPTQRADVKHTPRFKISQAYGSSVLFSQSTPSISR